MKRVRVILLVTAVLVGGTVLYVYRHTKVPQANITTIPTVVPTPPITEAITQTDAELLKKIDQLFIIGFRGYTYKTSPEVQKAIETTNIGGVILYDYDQTTGKYVRNIQTSAQVTALIADMKTSAALHNILPLLVSVDEEGGQVSRLKRLPGFNKTPSAAVLGSRPDSEVTSTAAGLGTALKNFGFNLDFAPDVDVNVNPRNPVIGAVDRSFSSDPAVVSEKGIAFFKGLQSAGIISAVKHFPGHGSSLTDSHQGFVNITDTHKAYELEPFKAVCAAGVPMVMVGHLFDATTDPLYPATLSKTTIDILKNETGCTNQVIISDDMDMGAIIKQYGRTEALTRALNAGIDILIISNNLPSGYNPNEFFESRQIVLDQVKAGVIPVSRIDEAYQKVQKLKAKYLKG